MLTKNFYRVRNIFRKIRAKTINLILFLYWKNKKKRISAMIRVKNGEDFLEASVLSIASVVDEVVFINNQSSDNTSEIIDSLALHLKDQLLIKKFEYNYNVVRVGEESFILQKKEPRSPCLTHNFYNWCVKQCSCPFILKWDDDMIATPELLKEIKSFKISSFLEMEFSGVNVAPDLKSKLSWNAGLEPRISPRIASHYVYCDYTFVQGGNFGGQTIVRIVTKENRKILLNPVYAHMKYCKKNPGGNQSPKFNAELEKNIKINGLLSPDIKKTVLKWLSQENNYH